MTSTTRPVLKVILVGDFGVGKSSLFRRFVYNTFLEDNSRGSTLGFDHFEKPFNVEGKEIMLQLWDTGGLERVASITSNYFKYAEAAILVFSYDAYESFNALANHMLETLEYADNTRIFLCGNKLDLAGYGNGPSEGAVEIFHKEYQLQEGENLIRRVYRVSCKSNEGVAAMFEDIARILARTCRTEPDPEPEHFQLRRSNSSQNGKGCCSGNNGEGGEG